MNGPTVRKLRVSFPRVNTGDDTKQHDFKRSIAYSFSDELRTYGFVEVICRLVDNKQQKQRPNSRDGCVEKVPPFHILNKQAVEQEISSTHDVVHTVNVC